MGSYKVFKPATAISSKNNTPVVQAEGYIKTFLDFLRERGILRSGFLSFQGSATNTLYTAPAGKVFYLTSISVALQNDAAISIPTCDVMLENSIILTIGAGKADGNHESVTVDFSIPIRLNSGKALTVYNNRANCWVRIAYMGFEVEEALSSQ